AFVANTIGEFVLSARVAIDAAENAVAVVVHELEPAGNPPRPPDFFLGPRLLRESVKQAIDIFDRGTARSQFLCQCGSIEILVPRASAGEIRAAPDNTG